MVNNEIKELIQPLRLVLHIGAGKTGTSSIQQTLNKNIVNLKNHGIQYLGLMLEKADDKLYDWQDASKIENFHNLPQKDIDDEVLNVFRLIIESAKSNNIHTLIWSNESFFIRCDKLFNILKHLENKGLQIEFVAYVRRHDAWARSAYVQWALKHKTIKGNILNFSKWIEKRKPMFYPQLKEILNVFPGQLHVRNMDSVKDVVSDFLLLCNLDTYELNTLRSNESPGNEELFLRALFNSQYEEEVLPNIFDEIIGSSLDFNRTPEEYLKELLPTEEDLLKIKETTEEDRILLNELLCSLGQEEMVKEKNSSKVINVDSDVLILSLSEIAMQQAKRIQRIEKVLIANDLYCI